MTLNRHLCNRVTCSTCFASDMRLALARPRTSFAGDLAMLACFALALCALAL